jgi:rhodanese-related sulfurtransferase
VKYQYLSAADLKADLESDAPECLILDVRRAEDYAAGHIKSAVTADMDKAMEGDDASGFAGMKKALLSATGSEIGRENGKIVLVCYAGRAYAQKGTDILVAMGVNPDKIYTLEGGMRAWNCGGADYATLIAKV